jgi:hypothetical protein
MNTMDIGRSDRDRQRVPRSDLTLNGVTVALPCRRDLSRNKKKLLLADRLPRTL